MRRTTLSLTTAAAALAASAAFVGMRTRQAEKNNPPLGKFVTVDGVCLHYVERGAGEPLILLHGNGSLVQEMLISGLVDLAARTHRVIVFDRPGYGWSERPRDRNWTPAAQAALLRKAAAKIGAENAHLYGHSWGTLVALEWALQEPASVRSLTLAGGYYFPTARLDALLISGNAVPVLGDLMRTTVTPIAGRALWPAILRALFSPAPVPERFRRFPRAFALSPQTLRAASEEAAMMTASAAGLQRRYRNLTLPVSIIAGEGDRIVDPQNQSVRLHGEIEGSALHLLPGVGHMVHHTDPEGVLKASAFRTEAIEPAAPDAFPAAQRRPDEARDLAGQL